MDKDYYKIMGVSPDASDKDIKTAYRKLARKYHPDISKEANAEEQFKEMGEAYEVLKDPVKRAEYDQYLKNREFNQNTRHSSRHTTAGQQHQYQGAQFDSDFFESLFGHSRYQQHQPMSGQNYQGKINITLEEAFNGAVKSLQVPVDQGPETKMQTLNVKVPAGIKSGQQIRLAGQGGSGVNGGPRGDLFLTVDVMKHSLFDVMENDIYLTLPLTPWEAALGTTVVVPTLSGKIDLKIPPGSQGGQKLRIKNRGLPGATPGNQYVLLKIITPPASTEAAKALYRKMAEEMPFNPREQMGA
jgi:curved DNA-binding protein